MAQMGKAGGAIEDLATRSACTRFGTTPAARAAYLEGGRAAERVDVAARVVRDLPPSPSANNCATRDRRSRLAAEGYGGVQAVIASSAAGAGDRQ